MAVYTGNNGRIYIARRANSGLTGTITQNIEAGQSTTIGQVLNVVTVRGQGTGGQYRATTAIGVNDLSRSCSFTVSTAGGNYADTDVVYLARYANNVLVRMTADFTVGSVNTVGVDNELDITVDNYRIAKIRDWSFNSNSEVIETTALGDVVKTFAPSITSGDGSATLMFYEDDLNSGASSNTRDIFELVDILFPRDVPPRVIMNLAVDGGSFLVDSENRWKTNFLFNAYVTSASVSVSYGEVVTVATNFTVDGPLLDVPWKPNVSRL
jgi:hypothetical protein